MKLSLRPLLLFAPLWFACAQKPASPVVATVDKIEITEADLKVDTQIVPLQKQEYEIKLRALENTVALKLLQRAAAQKNLTVEEFLKREVDSKIAEPSAAEIEGFYWGQRDKFREPLDKVHDQVAQALKLTKIQQGRSALLEKLRAQADIRVLLHPPRIAIAVGDAPRRGPASAPVTIVEYSDYQCPFCRQEEPVLQQLSAKYGDKLSLVYKDYPLYDIHPEAQAAAEAARCAGEQGKYWEYHDALFASPSLGSAVYEQTASRLKLDSNAFQGCVSSRKYKNQVEASFREAQEMGAKSTPAFFVNGVPLAGAQPITVFEKLIDAELESAQRPSK